MSNQGRIWKNHVFGLGYQQFNRKLLYIQIPKCASMWMRKYVQSFEYHPSSLKSDYWYGCKFNDVNFIAYQPIIFLRDPIERFLSYCPVKPILSITTFDSTLDNFYKKIISHNKFINFDNFFIDLENNLSRDDEHLTPQNEFLDGLNLDRAVFFKVNDQLSKNVSCLFKQHKLPSIEVPQNVNVSNLNYETNQAIDNWKKLLQLERYKEIFQKIYKKDYELIDQVDFYEAR